MYFVDFLQYWNFLKIKIIPGYHAVSEEARSYQVIPPPLKVVPLSHAGALNNLCKFRSDLEQKSGSRE